MKIFVSLSLVIILVLFSGGVGFAAPTINSVSGSLYHGGSVIISGIAFGSKTPAAPLIWDNFEWGSDGTLLNTGDWSDYKATNPCEIDTSQYYGQGTRSAYNMCYTPDYKNQFGMAYQYFTESDEIYFSHKYRWSKEIGATGRMFTKLHRTTGPLGVNPVYSGKPSFGHSYTHGIQYSMHAGDGVGGDIHDYIGYTSILPPDTWNSIEGYWKGSTPGSADGTVQSWNNLTLIWDKQSVMTRGEGITAGINSVLTSHNAVNPTVEDEEWYFWVDDFYLDNTQARVEIGDNATWGSCTKREIQIPTAWANDEITVSVNRGSFAPCETYYLFVVDADGVPSAGKEIKIVTGAGEAPCPPTAVEIK